MLDSLPTSTLRLVFEDDTTFTVTSPRRLARLEFDGQAIEWGVVAHHAKFVPPPIPVDRLKFLATSMVEVDWSVRTSNCLLHKMAEVPYSWNRRDGRPITVRDLCLLSEGEVVRTKNLGRKSLREILDRLGEAGLRLGMSESQLRQIEEQA